MNSTGRISVVGVGRRLRCMVTSSSKVSISLSIASLMLFTKTSVPGKPNGRKLR